MRHGKITKRGPEKLQTALIKVMIGMRRLPQRMALLKGLGKTIVSTAQKMAAVIQHILGEGAVFDLGRMVDRKLAKKAEDMNMGAAAS
ncbi:MAG: hypothetical protein LBB47_01520 [Spirochaetaceae bacterium]|nr:hypothetical protein [Spirochaetaceae bacterium]